MTLPLWGTLLYLMTRLLPWRALIQRLAIGIAGCAVITGLVWLGRPDETVGSRRARVQVECLLRHVETAAGLCQEAGGSFLPRRCTCRLPGKAETPLRAHRGQLLDIAPPVQR